MSMVNGGALEAHLVSPPNWLGNQFQSHGKATSRLTFCASWSIGTQRDIELGAPEADHSVSWASIIGINIHSKCRNAISIKYAVKCNGYLDAIINRMIEN